MGGSFLFAVLALLQVGLLPGLEATKECIYLDGVTNHPTVNGIYVQDDTLEECGSNGYNRYKHETEDFYFFCLVGGDGAKWTLNDAVCDDSSCYAQTYGYNTNIWPAPKITTITETSLYLWQCKSGMDDKAFTFPLPTIVSADCPSTGGGGTVSGDPHFLTLDNYYFDFQGKCSYILSQFTGEDLPQFKIVVKMWSFGEMSFTRNIRVDFGHHTVYLLQQNHIQVDQALSTKAPFYHHDFNITQNGNQSILTTWFGLQVGFSGRYMSKTVIPEVYAGRVSGLLGNFDGNPENDLRKPDGSTGTVCEVGESWQEADSGCTSECSNEPRGEELLDRYLEQIKKGKGGMVFSDPVDLLDNGLHKDEDNVNGLEGVGSVFNYPEVEGIKNDNGVGSVFSDPQKMKESENGNGVGSVFNYPEEMENLENGHGIGSVFSDPKEMKELENGNGIGSVFNYPEEMEDLENGHGIGSVFSDPEEMGELENGNGVGSVFNDPKEMKKFENGNGFGSVFSDPEEMKELEKENGMGSVFNYPEEMEGFEKENGMGSVFNYPEEMEGFEKGNGVGSVFNYPEEMHELEKENGIGSVFNYPEEMEGFEKENGMGSVYNSPPEVTGNKETQGMKKPDELQRQEYWEYRNNVLTRFLRKSMMRAQQMKEKKGSTLKFQQF